LNKTIFAIAVVFIMVSQAQASWIGQASFYRHPHYGGLIAAHRTLPFGTRLLVTNLGNGRTVTVVVVDRGPFIRSRILDVSTRAADALDFRRAGTARVKVEVVEK
jgi:rare lipoprotein A